MKGERRSNTELVNDQRLIFTQHPPGGVSSFRASAPCPAAPRDDRFRSDDGPRTCSQVPPGCHGYRYASSSSRPAAVWAKDHSGY